MERVRNNNLILLGGGGHCKSVIDVAEKTGYKIMGILDPNEQIGSLVMGYPVLGNDDCIGDYVDKALFLITVGQIKNCEIRKSLVNKVMSAGGQFATVIASDAYVSKHAKIGEGTVIMHGAIVNADAKIGNHCIINTMANIEHEVEIGDFCHISTGVMVNGMTKVGSNSFVGSGSVLYNCIKVSENSIIPAGTIVKSNIDKKI